MLWEIDIRPRPDLPDAEAERVARDAAELGIAEGLRLRSASCYLVESGKLDRKDIERLAAGLFVDRVAEVSRAGTVDEPLLSEPPDDLKVSAKLVHVLPKPGVMDPVAQSAEAAARDLGFPVGAVRTMRKYWIAGLDEPSLTRLGQQVLANDAIEQLIIGPLGHDRLELGGEYRFPARNGADPRVGRRCAQRAESLGTALPATGRDADDP